MICFWAKESVIGKEGVEIFYNYLQGKIHNSQRWAYRGEHVGRVEANAQGWCPGHTVPPAETQYTGSCAKALEQKSPVTGAEHN